jgi:hypothetical protein
VANGSACRGRSNILVEDSKALSSWPACKRQRASDLCFHCLLTRSCLLRFLAFLPLIIVTSTYHHKSNSGLDVGRPMLVAPGMHVSSFCTRCRMNDYMLIKFPV